MIEQASMRKEQKDGFAVLSCYRKSSKTKDLAAFLCLTIKVVENGFKASEHYNKIVCCIYAVAVFVN